MKMRKGNETEIEIRMKMPGDVVPIHIPGVLITEGMSNTEIERAMILSSKLIVEHLVFKRALRYFPIEPRKIEGLSKLLKND